MHSDTNDEKQVMRIRFNDICDATLNEDDDEEEKTVDETAVNFIKKL
jgi:hypothetical protein